MRDRRRFTVTCPACGRTRLTERKDSLCCNRGCNARWQKMNAFEMKGIPFIQRYICGRV